MPSTQSSEIIPPNLSSNFQADPDALIIPIQSIEISTNAPRKDYDKDQLEELSKDIKQKGILEPLLVIKTPSLSKSSQKFLLISGHRRLKAALNIGLSSVPVRLTNCNTEEEKLATQLCENIQRKDLHPIEIALILRFFLELGLKEKEIADRISKSLSWVSKYKKISKMPKQILEDPLALTATLSDLLSLESHFPRHSDLISAWSIYLSEGLKNALKGSDEYSSDSKGGETSAELSASNRSDNMIGLTREFLIVTKNQNVLNCRMQISESKTNDIRVILPQQYSVEEIQEIFDKIIQSIDHK